MTVITDSFVDAWLKLFGTVPAWMLPEIPKLTFRPTMMPVYILCGQSNATGAAPNSGLTEEQSKPVLSVMIFADGTMIDANIAKRWRPVTVGFGADKTMFGPELGLAQAMKEAERSALIVKYTAPGTALADYWCSPTTDGAGPGYVRLLRTIRDAHLDPVTSYYAGICMMQGEADACNKEQAQNYGGNAMHFIHDLREALGNQATPFVMGKIHTSSFWPYGAEVQAMQDWVWVFAKPSIKLMETEDLALQTTNPHYDSQSEYELGLRFAEALK